MIDLNDKITPHFKWREMLRTNYEDYQERNIELGLTEPYKSNIIRLCETILEPMRIFFGKPVVAYPVFRYAEQVDGVWTGVDVVIRKNGRIGYSPKSQHTRGEAADLEISGIDDMDIWNWVRNFSPNPFGQVILERPPGQSWIHVSIPGIGLDGRYIFGEVETYDGESYKLVEKIDRW